MQYLNNTKLDYEPDPRSIKNHKVTTTPLIKKQTQQDAFEDNSYLDLKNLESVDIAEMKVTLMDINKEKENLLKDIATLSGLSTVPNNRAELHKAIINNNKGRESELATALVNFMHDNKNHPSSEVEDFVFQLLHHMECYDEMNQLFLDLGRFHFTTNPINREKFVNSLVESGKPELQELAKFYISNFLRDDLAIGSTNRSLHNAELMFIRAKLYEKNNNYDKAIKLYEQAFVLSKDVRHGDILLEKLINTAKYSDYSTDQWKIKIHIISHMVYMACLADGGSETKDLNLAKTLLMSAMLSDQSPDVLSRIASGPAFEIDSLSNFNDYLTDLKKTNNTKEDINTIENMLLEQEVNNCLDTLSTRLNQIRKLPDNNSEEELFWKKSYSYRGATRSKKLAGNIHRGGQLYDSYLSRIDTGIFRNLNEESIHFLIGNGNPEVRTKLKEAGLSLDCSLGEISDPDLYCKVIDIFIRESFRTELLELEDLHSKGHVKYDQRIQKLSDLFQINTAKPDSLTNISANLFMGIGDCRHHAQVKQIMYDCWQADKIERIMKETYSHPENAGIHLNQVKEILSNQLITLDVQVLAPVQMKKKYEPVKSSKGNLLLDQNGDMQILEDHTMNALVKKDETGKVLSAKTKDSFYHNEYAFSDAKMEFNEKHGLYVGDNLAVEKADKIGTVPVYLRPTKYAGKRDLYEPASEGIYFMNQPVKELSSEDFNVFHRVGISTFYSNLDKPVENK